MILRPQRPFTIVRQLNNPFITDTFYVRAVVRDAYTDAVLDTISLTDRTAQRFTGIWQVAADPSGLGREISIVTSVYADSGYTTKSENYGDEESSHTIEDRYVGGKSGAGGPSMPSFGASGPDARTIRRIVKEELASQAEEDKAADGTDDISLPPVPMRWEEILSAIDGIKEGMKPQEQKPVDLSPVLKALRTVEQAVKDNKAATVSDIKPLLDKLDDKSEDQDFGVGHLEEMIRNLEANITGKVHETVAKAMASTNFITSFVTHAATPEGKPIKAPEEPKPEKPKPEEKPEPADDKPSEEVPEERPIDLKVLTQ